MKNINIVFLTDLKNALVEMHEEEQIANKAGNPLHANGLSQARIIIENVLADHGFNRPSRITTENGKNTSEVPE